MKIELSLQPELDPEGCGGAEKHHFFDVFLEPCCGMAVGAHFGDFGSLLGTLLAPTEQPFGSPFLMLSGGVVGRGWNAPPPPQNTISEGPWGGLQEGNRTSAKIGERIEDHTPRLVTPEGVGG